MANTPEIYLDTRGEAGIENFDDLARHFPKWADRAINSALSSEGHRVLGILKSAFPGGPPGHSWEKLHPYTMRLRKGYRNRPRKKTPKALTGTQRQKNPLGKFRGGLRYKVDKSDKMLSVGFVNASTQFQQILKKQTQGYSVNVSRSMQKLFFALGLPLAAGTKRLEVEPRPLIEPVFESERERILDNLERKFFFENLDRYSKE